jgi:hypothetical protein
MLTIAEAQRQTELFLTGQMFEALHAVEYELPSPALTSRRERCNSQMSRARASRSAMCAGLPMPPTSSMPLATSY